MTHESIHCPAGTHPCGPTFQRKRRSLLASRVASSTSVSLDVGAAAARGRGKHTGPHAIQCSSCCCSYQGMISTSSRAKVCVGVAAWTLQRWRRRRQAHGGPTCHPAFREASHAKGPLRRIQTLRKGPCPREMTKRQTACLQPGIHPHTDKRPPSVFSNPQTLVDVVVFTVQSPPLPSLSSPPPSPSFHSWGAHYFCGSAPRPESL